MYSYEYRNLHRWNYVSTSLDDNTTNGRICTGQRDRNLSLLTQSSMSVTKHRSISSLNNSVNDVNETRRTHFFLDHRSLY